MPSAMINLAAALSQPCKLHKEKMDISDTAGTVRTVDFFEANRMIFAILNLSQQQCYLIVQFSLLRLVYTAWRTAITSAFQICWITTGIKKSRQGKRYLKIITDLQTFLPSAMTSNLKYHETRQKAIGLASWCQFWSASSTQLLWLIMMSPLNSPAS